VLNALSQYKLLIRDQKYPRPVTDAYLLELKALDEGEEHPSKDDPTDSNMTPTESITHRTGDESSHVDNPDVPIRFSEKKRLNWAGKTCKPTIASSHDCQ